MSLIRIKMTALVFVLSSFNNDLATHIRTMNETVLYKILFFFNYRVRSENCFVNGLYICALIQCMKNFTFSPSGTYFFFNGTTLFTFI